MAPAIFRMNAILAARETPFEEARAELRDALLMDRARRILAENLDLYEDLLAGGATVTQLAAETEMQEGQIDWRPDVRSGIAAYEEFRDAARDVQAGDFAEILLLDDGGMFALELVEGLPATPRPLDDIRTQVVQDWQSDEIRARLSTLAEALMEEVEGGTAIDALGLDSLRFADLSRSDPVPDLPGAVLETGLRTGRGRAGNRRRWCAGACGAIARRQCPPTRIWTAPNKFAARWTSRSPKAMRKTCSGILVTRCANPCRSR